MTRLGYYRHNESLCAANRWCCTDYRKSSRLHKTIK